MKALSLAVLSAAMIVTTATVPAKPERLCGGHRATIVGNRAANILVGTPKRDVIWAGGGDDYVIAGSGNDLICGKRGDDHIVGGPGWDRARGGRGNDTCDTERIRNC